MSFSWPTRAINPWYAARMKRDDSIASSIPTTSPVYVNSEAAIQTNARAVAGAKIRKKPRSRNPSGFQ